MLRFKNSLAKSKITEDDIRKIDTFLKEMRLAGYYTWDGLEPASLNKSISYYSCFRVAVVSRNDRDRIGGIWLQFNQKSAIRPWLVFVSYNSTYKYLDSALDAMANGARECIPLPTSGIADV